MLRTSVWCVSARPSSHGSPACMSEVSGEEPVPPSWSFFFYWYGDHRDLHSFPTRRSSDLRQHQIRRHRDPGGPGHRKKRKYQIVDDVDRKSTRLNSSHTVISYAVFCLK